jgi:hypothetical protein
MEGSTSRQGPTLGTPGDALLQVYILVVASKHHACALAAVPKV